MKTVIMISGKRRSGKGLMTDMIKKLHYNSEVVSFAKPIKESAASVIEHLRWQKQDKEVLRPLWISIGAIGRAISKTYWSKWALDYILSDPSDNKLYIIDDLRYRDEVKVFTDCDKINVYTIRINKDTSYGEILAADMDSSETDFDNVDLSQWFNFIIPANTIVRADGVNYHHAESYAKAILDQVIN